ncbi:hypothetical protein SAMN04487843_11614 [Methylobacterium sp. ap11]|uniref:hypothetical protein n=1 Tax=Methylobacterium sp. ap11 TaxID=1761799 RepID=UPI0008BD7ABE|nr:hypothetical protein [Methylobacterium sp. ap11]SEP40681.1 hypothetical protein SAMN04487843_11614 [Methylobacterium sp. ap11]
MTATAPAPTLDVNIGDKSHQVLMSFGMLNELAELVGSIEQLPAIDFDTHTRTTTLEVCLASRDERGRRDPEWFLPPALTVEAAEAVLDFAKEHLFDFFVGRLEKHLSSLQANGTRLKAVGSSLSGSAASAS